MRVGRDLYRIPPSFLHVLVQLVQIDVGEQGRYYSALRRAAVRASKVDVVEEPTHVHFDQPLATRPSLLDEV